MEKAIITNIQGYSIHDGPGIRTVVFFKGCPLRCIWCSNPENLTAAAQVGYFANLCKNCGRCMKACRYGAIFSGDGYRIDRNKCTSCLECVDACYYGALVRYGEEKTSEEVFELVRRDKMFYDSSGGGVTVSGGEPLLHPEFVYELFSLCKGHAIHTCIETCGDVQQNAFERVLPVTDLFYFDLKLMDNTLHREYTGRGNAQIHENARYIVSRGAKVLFRQPLIPEITATEDNIRQTAEFIKEIGAEDTGIQLMPFHRAGKTKYDALNLKYAAKDTEPMTAEQIEDAQTQYLACGVNCTVSK